MSSKSSSTKQPQRSSASTAVIAGAPLIPIALAGAGSTAGTAGVAGVAAIGLAGGGLITGAVTRHRPGNRRERRAAERSVRRTERSRQTRSKSPLGASSPKASRKTAGSQSVFGGGKGTGSKSSTASRSVAGQKPNQKSSKSAANLLGGSNASSKSAKSTASKANTSNPSSKSASLLGGGSKAPKNRSRGGGGSSLFGGGSSRTAGHSTNRPGSRNTASSSGGGSRSGSGLGNLVFGSAKKPKKTSTSGGGLTAAAATPAGGSTAKAVRRQERTTRLEKRRAAHARRQTRMANARKNQSGQLSYRTGERRFLRGGKRTWNIAATCFLVAGSIGSAIFYWACWTGHHVGNRARATHSDLVAALQAPYSGIAEDWHRFRQSRYERRYAILRAAGEEHPVVNTDDLDTEGGITDMKRPGVKTNLRPIIEAVQEAKQLGNGERPHLQHLHQWFYDLEELSDELNGLLRTDAEIGTEILPSHGSAHDITAEVPGVFRSATEQVGDARVAWQVAYREPLLRQQSEHPGEEALDVSTAPED